MATDPLADSVNNRITAVFSTVENLLNPYRLARSGLQQWVSCDMTYRVASDTRQGFMIIGTGDMGQHFKLIAFAIVNKEDLAAHEHVVRQTRDAVNAVVQSYGRRGMRV
jgi:hypothetical protein